MAAYGWAIQSISWFVTEKQFRTLPKDLYKDRELQWLARWYYPLWALYITTAALVSTKLLVFFVLAPVAWALTSAALLNTLGHMETWGSQQPWPTEDRSQNHQWLAIFLLGEGLHNNHHWAPAAADQGQLTGQWDFAGRVIKRYIEK
jgi:stearoyl-CoA desaturase (delta-9 desaturase)